MENSKLVPDLITYNTASLGQVYSHSHIWKKQMNVDTLTWRTSTVIHWLHVCPRKSKVDQALLLDIFYMDHTKDPCCCFVLGFQHVVFCFLCYYLVWTKSCRWFSEQMGMFTKRWTQKSQNHFFKRFPQYWPLNNCPANNPKINWDSIIKECWLDGPLRYSQPGPSYLRMCYYVINRCNHIEYIDIPGIPYFLLDPAFQGVSRLAPVNPKFRSNKKQLPQATKSMVVSGSP